MKRDAFLSACGLYRYWLTRVWDDGLPLLCVIMLNPSKADALRDDHTITKLIQFAKRAGFGGIIVANLYAFRATKPADMRAAADPVGPGNDDAIIDAIYKAPHVLCAWGGNAAGTPREHQIRLMMRLHVANGGKVYALRVNSDGTPAHPLMLPYSCTLQEWRP